MPITTHYTHNMLLLQKATPCHAFGHLAGVTDNPNEMWVNQQARQLVWELDDRETPLRFLIHDNDSKFSKAFDALFETEDLHVIHTPYLAPNANAYSERWVRTAREESLDLILILNAAHLRRVLTAYIDDYYNVARPHQGIGQQIPIPRRQPLFFAKWMGRRMKKRYHIFARYGI